MSGVGNLHHRSEMTTVKTTSSHLANSTFSSLHATGDNQGISNLNFCSSGKLFTFKKRKRKSSLIGDILSSGLYMMVHEGSGRVLMKSEKCLGRLACMINIAPSRKGRLSSISIYSVSEKLEIPRKASFPEEVYQTTMSTSEACSPQNHLSL